MLRSTRCFFLSGCRNHRQCSLCLTTEWWPGWVGLSYITRCYARQNTVTHPRTNRAQRRVTSLIRQTPLYHYARLQGPNQQKTASCYLEARILHRGYITTWSIAHKLHRELTEIYNDTHKLEEIREKSEKSSELPKIGRRNLITEGCAYHNVYSQIRKAQASKRRFHGNVNYAWAAYGWVS